MDYTREFEAFWKAYGKVGSKNVAAKKFTSARKKDSFETIMRGTTGYLESLKKKRAAEGWAPNVMHASRFLGNEIWTEFQDVKPGPVFRKAESDDEARAYLRSKNMRIAEAPELPDWARMVPVGWE